MYDIIFGISPKITHKVVEPLSVHVLWTQNVDILWRPLHGLKCSDIILFPQKYFWCGNHFSKEPILQENEITNKILSPQQHFIPSK